MDFLPSKGSFGYFQAAQASWRKSPRDRHVEPINTSLYDDTRKENEDEDEVRDVPAGVEKEKSCPAAAAVLPLDAITTTSRGAAADDVDGDTSATAAHQESLPQHRMLAGGKIQGTRTNIFNPPEQEDAIGSTSLPTPSVATTTTTTASSSPSPFSMYTSSQPSFQTNNTPFSSSFAPPGTGTAGAGINTESSSTTGPAAFAGGFGGGSNTQNNFNIINSTNRVNLFGQPASGDKETTTGTSSIITGRSSFLFGGIGELAATNTSSSPKANQGTTISTQFMSSAVGGGGGGGGRSSFSFNPPSINNHAFGINTSINQPDANVGSTGANNIPVFGSGGVSNNNNTPETAFSSFANLAASTRPASATNDSTFNFGAAAAAAAGVVSSTVDNDTPPSSLPTSHFTFSLPSQPRDPFLSQNPTFRDPHQGGDDGDDDDDQSPSSASVTISYSSESDCSVEVAEPKSAPRGHGSLERHVEDTPVGDLSNKNALASVDLTRPIPSGLEANRRGSDGVFTGGTTSSGSPTDRPEVNVVSSDESETMQAIDTSQTIETKKEFHQPQSFSTYESAPATKAAICTPDIVPQTPDRTGTSLRAQTVTTDPPPATAGVSARNDTVTTDEGSSAAAVSSSEVTTTVLRSTDVLSTVDKVTGQALSEQTVPVKDKRHLSEALADLDTKQATKTPSAIDDASKTTSTTETAKVPERASGSDTKQTKMHTRIAKKEGKSAPNQATTKSTSGRTRPSTGVSPKSPPPPARRPEVIAAPSLEGHSRNSSPRTPKIENRSATRKEMSTSSSGQTRKEDSTEIINSQFPARTPYPSPRSPSIPSSGDSSKQTEKHLVFSEASFQRAEDLAREQEVKIMERQREHKEKSGSPDLNDLKPFGLNSRQRHEQYQKKFAEKLKLEKAVRDRLAIFHAQPYLTPPTPEEIRRSGWSTTMAKPVHLETSLRREANEAKRKAKPGAELSSRANDAISTDEKSKKQTNAESYHRPILMDLISASSHQEETTQEASKKVSSGAARQRQMRMKARKYEKLRQKVRTTERKKKAVSLSPGRVRSDRPATTFDPFDLKTEERRLLHEKRLRQKISEERKEFEKHVHFRANPIPQTLYEFTPDPYTKDPLNFKSMQRKKLHEERIRQQQVADEEEIKRLQKLSNSFQARPAPITTYQANLVPGTTDGYSPCCSVAGSTASSARRKTRPRTPKSPRSLS